MLFGMPLDAWLLLLVAVGLGLALELAFYRARRHRGGGLSEAPVETGPSSPGEGGPT